ncbi:MAG TPA: pilus assembly protein TadG-related protein [Candidatus Dormibacteraeota bacterium]|nr:pilus assembly protein TadG-related protein [Candidatus Dormibacteraeota bacterium]
MPNTRISTSKRNLQEGQAIVLIALLILVLFGMLGLAVDSGRGYVDRRDQQTAVDAAALAAGDWYDNYPDATDLQTKVVPFSVNLYMSDLRIYSGATLANYTFGTTGLPPNNNLRWDKWQYTFAGSYQLTITATNTQFNGYQFQYDSQHDLPLTFIQIFGGSPTIPIGATATSIVGNQRQSPALLTLSTGACATQMQGAGQLTILGDAYTNGTACVDANLRLAGNCYGASGSNCANASYWCYNSIPGFIPYQPNPTCNGSDVLGTSYVPAPSLPDPGYLAGSQPSYLAPGATHNRGNYIEMTPGQYNNWSVNGGGCYFLDPGVYTWNGGYSSHGALTSNELKAPHEEYWSQPGSLQYAGSGAAGVPASFWGSAGCGGDFALAVLPAPGNGIKHNGGGGKWGVVLTSVRWDTFNDPAVSGNPCLNPPGCRRESTPSACYETNTLDVNNSGIAVTVTSNAPGAQYYNVYVDPNGCEVYPGGDINNFSFTGRFLAPGWTDGGGPPATASLLGPWAGLLTNGTGGWPCAVPTVTICNIAYNNLSPTKLCYAQTRSQLCQPPDDEVQPQCFGNCPAAISVPANNAPMKLQYPLCDPNPNLCTGGDVTNEDYCVISPNPGDPNAPCTTAKITTGAVQFYIPAGGCLDQNGNGSTHVFSGEQYNWIVIYEPASNNCPITGQHLNGNSLTQYIGTIYSPAASWDILGSNTAPLAGQVICYTAKVTGSGNAGIDFNPNFSPAPPAARLIN